MRLNAIGHLEFYARALTGTPEEIRAGLVELRVGPIRFTLTEAEAVRLAHRVAAAVEHHRHARKDTP